MAEFEFDARYEFDAPKHYDFTKMSQEDSRASDWFHTRDCTLDDAATRRPLKETQRLAIEDQAQQEDAQRKSNIVTSWGGPTARSNPVAAGPSSAAAKLRAGPPSASKAASSGPTIVLAPPTVPECRPAAKPAAKPAAPQPALRSASVPRASRIAAGEPAAGMRSRPAAPARTAARMVPPADMPPPATTISRTAPAAGPPASRSISAPPVRPQAALPDYELPVTRSAAKRMAVEARPMTRSFAKQIEPLQLRLDKHVGHTKHEGKHHPKPQPALSLEQVLQPVKLAPVRSTKPLTLPEDFDFHTSKRLRAHDTEQVEHDDRAADAAPSPWKSLAQKVKEFQSKTPARFKSKPVPLPFDSHRGSWSQRPQITEAKEPVLWTSTRSRPSVFKTREEEEAEMMASMPSFHARPVKDSILKGISKQTLPRVERKSTTEPQPFNLATDKRGSAKRPAPEDDQSAAGAKRDSQTKAWRDERGFTIAKSPMLRTKYRAHDDKPKFEEPRYQFRARDMPKFSAGSKPARKSSVEPKEPISLQPFHLRTEQRGSQHKAQLQEKLQQLEEQERVMRVPKARGLPVSTDMPFVPPKPQPKTLTMPEPFELRSEARHSEYQQQYLEQLEVEEETRRRQANFKAREKWGGKFYQIRPSDAPLTMPEEPQLATDARAMEREEFDSHIKEKWQQIEEEKARQEEERKRKEEDEAKAFRKGIKFEARQMPDFSHKPAAPVPSRKRLTMPVSPKLQTSKRHKTAK